jgi:anthranilate synthase component I
VLTPKNLEEFCALAQQYDIVPVVCTVAADLHTPLSAYLKTSDDEYSFLFESIEGGEHLARYSFMGANPRKVIRLSASDRPDVSRLLRNELSGKTVAPISKAPLAGGVVGYLGYAMARCFEPAVSDVSTGDDAVLMIFDTAIVHDRVRQVLEIREAVDVHAARSDRAELEEMYSAAVKSTEQIATHLKADNALCAKELPSVHFEANQTRDEFESRVDAVKKLIKAGECYQAVISQRFSARTDADAIAIYRALRMSNPSPYMFLLRMGERSLIGASPEMLVRCRGAKLEYRPIAGTRLRGANEHEDDRLALDLLADEKERSEHTMLVDLGRNDLGRVAKIGSVRVKDVMRVEKFSHVQHLVTDLTAELRDGLDCFDALASCFPAGTVTGAPKIRAMQAIAEIEPDARGVYSGTVFYADHAGNLDSCIAIRTIELHDGLARVQAGAGIVSDSDPAKEYEETINKAHALQQAVATAGSVA